MQAAIRDGPILSRTRKWDAPCNYLKATRRSERILNSASGTVCIPIRSNVRRANPVQRVMGNCDHIRAGDVVMGAQAQRWVLEYGGHMYESMVSYYPSIQGLDFTVGDDHIAPKSLEEAVGRPLDQRGVTTCFGCHATNAVIDHKLNLTSFKPGVTCEHCHIGASAHFAAAVQGDLSVLPPLLAKFSVGGDFGFLWSVSSNVGAGGELGGAAPRTCASSLIVWLTANASMGPIHASAASRATIHTRRFRATRHITTRNVSPVTLRQRRRRRHMRGSARWQGQTAQRVICRRCPFQAATLFSLITISES